MILPPANSSRSKQGCSRQMNGAGSRPTLRMRVRQITSAPSRMSVRPTAKGVLIVCTVAVRDVSVTSVTVHGSRAASPCRSAKEPP